MTAPASGPAGGLAKAPPRPTELRFGYGTNGFANHRLFDALAVIADLGYQGVALTLDHDHLDPFAPGLARRVAAVHRRLAALGLSVVVETGARYLLDPWHKHAPTLLHDDPAPRVEFLRRAVSIGADLDAEAVSFWAGVRPPHVPEAVARDRLVAGCAEVCAAADAAGVPLGFEPEPGMLVEEIAGWWRLRDALGGPPRFGLTLDIGHCRCLEPLPVPECVAAVADHLVNVQIDDMRRGVHEHLEFGEGEIDFPPVLRALAEAGYRGLVAVELPRHSHAAPTVAARSIEFLRSAARAADVAAGRVGPAAPSGPAGEEVTDSAPLLCCSGGNTRRPMSGQPLLRGVQQSKGGG
ncbi:Sugar phosphate isomerase/epimerase [Micromonospora rhizosphaerae]|uniref:Sugar phosphate isomerase/epimerase n=1 Tax=Micromonospora rhizosphaerae TaxID=568872 RepID=A0A1C6T9N0_9ACTN|nr:sugar phosphate isomerase/epimerase family protein [Micromonospora rhizosphaerae]SCL38379.1 Sugar phosphate isomerase/epimerase [Micromonospora rhizosphaerae]